MAVAFPDGPLRFEHLKSVAATLRSSPAMEDK